MTIAQIVTIAWQRDRSRQAVIAREITISLSTKSRDAILEHRTILEYS